jgi:hypothetical protein
MDLKTLLSSRRLELEATDDLGPFGYRNLLARPSGQNATRSTDTNRMQDQRQCNYAIDQKDTRGKRR